MKKAIFIYVLLLLLICIFTNFAKAENIGFVTTNGNQFELNGQPHFFTGTNFWYGINLGMADPNGDRVRLNQELDLLRGLGITNLRIMAGSEGPDSEPWRIVPALQVSPGVYNPNVLDGLDYLLKEMNERGMRAVMCLNNFWPWSGGMAQYVNWNGGGPIPYPPPQPGGDWNTYAFYTDNFYSNAGAKQDFYDHINFIVNHINPYTGLAYKDDPAIFAWELANEPRGYQNGTNFNAWIDNTAAYIKSLDINHLVTTGCEGDTPWPAWHALDFVANHNGLNIDYATCHIWPQNWGWFDPANPSTFTTALNNALSYLQSHLNRAANALNKPMVLEEFGLARDSGSYDPNSSTTYRDLFYETMFDEIYLSASTGGSGTGDNFWAWAGKGQPLVPYGSLWGPGDPWIGDPPHEYQGWYSVYDTDTSTLAIISDHADYMYYLSPIIGDIDLDRDVDFKDFARFAPHWQKDSCGPCSEADLDDDGDVDNNDLAKFALNWLLGAR
jgi:mannan endo-1,4-beta-mannosidase